MPSAADIVNRALDAIGRSDLVIGDLEEGTEAARPMLRQYGPCRRQLLRSARWDFARKQAPMTLLGDATGQTADVGTLVTVPWIYEYAYPIDCVAIRFIPANNQQPSETDPPIMTGLGLPVQTWQRLIPARFLVGLDYNYPVVTGTPASWEEYPQWWNTSGEGPQQRTVVLTNIQNAMAVYTCDVIYPSQWDALFEEAMVAMLAQKCALTLAKDRKEALALRRDQIAICKDAIKQARIADGNEGNYSNDIPVDWMRARNAGGGWGQGGPGGGYGGGDLGVLGYGWSSISFGDGTAF